MTKRLRLKAERWTGARPWHGEVENPANVLSRFEGLRGSGGTFFMLDQLQKDNEVELWGGEDPKVGVSMCSFNPD